MPAILLSWDLEPIFCNRLGIERCAAWCNGAISPAVKNGRIELPQELLAICAEMKDEWRRSLKCHNFRRLAVERSITHPNCAVHVANIRMMRSETTPLADPTFLVTFETTPVPGAKSLSRESVFAALARLTPRELEIAQLCGNGKSNAEIATALSRSVGTIKAELHSVFKKLGVRSRTELVTMLLQT